MNIPGTNLEYHAPAWLSALGLKIDKKWGKRSIAYNKIPQIIVTPWFQAQLEALAEEIQDERQRTEAAMKMLEDIINDQAAIDAMWKTLPAVYAGAEATRLTAETAASQQLFEAEKRKALAGQGMQEVKAIRKLNRAGKFADALKLTGA